MNIIKTFEPNEQGRDFVIGDLHGSASCLDNLLEHLDFDQSRDRMFSVGDLVDRGPEPLACLGLIDQDWFHCTLSNHEQMMLEAFFGGPTGEYWFMNGGSWGMEAFNDRKGMHHPNELHRRIPSEDSVVLYQLLEKVKQLPYLITVKMKDGRKFHIIHAELPPGYEITDEILTSPGKVETLAKVPRYDGGECFLWGRFLFNSLYRADLVKEQLVKAFARQFNGGTYLFNDKLSHVISGHTIVKRPVTILGQTNIDTGAYSSYQQGAPSWAGLTCIELGTWKFYQATETTFKEVEPLIINKADLQSVHEQRNPT